MSFLNDLKNALKGKNKICDPLLLYIIIGIFKFVILYMIFLDFKKESYATYNKSQNKVPSINIMNIIMAINFMFYLYVVFGMFLQLLCANNMKNAAWFVLLYPFISRVVWGILISK